MKKAVAKHIALAVICLVVACVFWASTMDLILSYVGIHSGRTIGVIMVFAFNALHYNFGFFHPDSISPNTEHNVFYGDYLHIKIISFLTVGTSIHITKAKEAHCDEGNP